MFERPNTVIALDRAAIQTGHYNPNRKVMILLRNVEKGMGQTG